MEEWQPCRDDTAMVEWRWTDQQENDGSATTTQRLVAGAHITLGHAVPGERRIWVDSATSQVTLRPSACRGFTSVI